ncbi:imidazole glycerol phosphate synthase subunit HisH [Leptospira stimsonii]|uniref:Imidazole glycerol phosphate synthase subunit HisH n=1 Tax=Leptospira stimsonii TaxID=2202203 RepID=A0A4R9KZ84_9LEPT|nr:imidazole glycerol phosphate synthase subunit HisH [Leptospira stimsonii]RHX86316.1 imidazole glycerol phosphate synthase subunit HisH [Leptospira stimsonii]TGK14561.1 imidazole glycerol phosphate synthase subunit HisH [Leptospira stimsonii]TGM09984.1 imidazole glycerol phosphate synthase subunit HisH [Leptospira stimsonii]
MKIPDVSVIDYGVGNLLSVCRAFEYFGAKVEATSDPEIILSSPHVVLPGVGAFADGMNELERQGLVPIVKKVASNGTPLLGICLGMQMLLDESEEFGITAGLGLVAGKVVPVPDKTIDGKMQKIPHIGWNELKFDIDSDNEKPNLLKNVQPGDSVYFVHSFMAMPQDLTNIVAHCNYGGRKVTAVIRNKNVHGCQFHPEKSGTVGLNILRGFLTL